MRLSKHRPRFTARLLPLLAALGMAIPGYLSAATGPTTQDGATRQLFAAVQTNDFQAVQSSIAAGADVEARNAWGNTAADMAVDKGYFRIAHYLVSIRNFQRAKGEPPVRTAPTPVDAKAAPTQTRPPAAPASSAASSRRSAQVTAGPTTTPAMAGPAAANTSPAAPPLRADSVDAFDPSRPAYGAILPAASGRKP